jgi:acyl-coenzyme A synthetase/AMP-(fatty) acid ligase
VERPIKYFSFWDVPRTFAFEQAGKVYVLTSEFDDDLDEYPDDYDVFVVSGIGSLSVVSDWKSIEPLPKTRIGKIPVAAVHFDESRRKLVDSSCLESIPHSEQQ